MLVFDIKPKLFDVDNYPEFIKNMHICEITKLADYRINLPFNVSQSQPW